MAAFGFYWLCSCQRMRAWKPTSFSVFATVSSTDSPSTRAASAYARAMKLNRRRADDDDDNGTVLLGWVDTLAEASAGLDSIRDALKSKLSIV